MRYQAPGVGVNPLNVVEGAEVRARWGGCGHPEIM